MGANIDKIVKSLQGRQSRRGGIEFPGFPFSRE